jgi:hypothetical protein
MCDCEIEDLVSSRLITAFVRQNPRCLRRELEERNGAVHCEFQGAHKPNFARFVEMNAALEDLNLIVDALKSLRYHVGLTADGDATTN